MDLEAAGGVAPTGQGDCCRDAEHERALDDRLAAAAEMDDISLRAVILILLGLTPALAYPPAWVSRAHETGEQLLRALLFEFLIKVALVGLVFVGLLMLCADHPLRLAPTERALEAARRLFMAVVTFAEAPAVVASSESWGETAAASSVVAASAAVTWLYLLGELKGTARFLGASLVGVAACIIYRLLLD